MKIVWLILVLFLVVPMLFAVDILSAEFALELGWLPQGTLNMYEQTGNQVWYEDGYYWITEVDRYDLSNTFYTLLSTRVYYLECLFLGGSVDVSIHKQQIGHTFSTDGIDWMAEAGMRIGILEIFYIHNCIHPAPTYLYSYLFAGKWEASHDRIGIKISGKIGSK
jgi:hypothetical protein